jgi:hypothetical protein
MLNFVAESYSKKAAKLVVAVLALNAYTDNEGRLLSRPPNDE